MRPTQLHGQPPWAEVAPLVWTGRPAACALRIFIENEQVPREIKAIPPVRPAVRAEQAVLRPVAGFRRTLSDERERRRKVFLDRGELARRSSKATTIRRRHGPTDVVSDRAGPDADGAWREARRLHGLIARPRVAGGDRTDHPRPIEPIDRFHW